ncbi:Tumor susceptibility gene 101 protein [Lachnellula hyalina]|uniref:Tumor susceptibility gene 101 protein n=1 Tax=Lachnellula hyalina TaxID=1316788 RepID=A0A8H8QYH5_9HELO|nr:Tumor susceptibility gene 101 protein [Lachnellula hyalina]TVY25079.1 Tumor susceptibility gene 101 protein [Lachnellula hyalina]
MDTASAWHVHHNARASVVMAAVRQQVLNWLYSVLTSEYKDVNRTYNDVAQTLSHYSSLSPRTEVYTYENGASALLLQLSGTLPVNFRGTTYRFPVALWVQHGYPQEAPLVYVTPTEGMAVRPGQHVDPQGKIYHPYLVGWAEYWDKSNIVDFLAILRDVFANEPPVISRQQNTAPPRPQSAQAPPPIPPLPPGVGVARPPSGASSVIEQPPPPPPKPVSNSQPYSSAGPSRRDSGPPLPPLPTQISYDGGRYGPPIQSSPGGRSHAPQRSSSLRYETAPPLPPQPQDRRESHSPVSPITPPEEPYRRPSYTQTYQPPQQPQYTSNPIQQGGPPQNRPQMPPSYMQQQPYPNQQAQWQQQQHHTKSLPPPPDLIDAPLTLPIPSQASTNLPAPPIPPNPEKDMMLHNIGLALQSQRQHTRTQTTSSIPGLESQHKAMLQALSNMQAEMSALESLNSLLNTNTSVLHTALHDADSVIESSQHRTAPNVDELLVAPTVVGNQLYELVSEERSLGDALFVLGRAVERGRVSAPVFAKLTRSLAREWYLKKALVRKVGRGMGLATY